MATINDVFPGTSLTLFDAVPVFGRTVVVHEDNAAQGNPRCGCGVVGGAFGVHSAMMTTARYPEYTGGYLPEVLAWLSEASGTLTMQALLTGLEPGARGGFHIHDGFTCSSKSLVGGHYFDGVDVWLNDAWKYTADSDGVAAINLTLADFSLEGALAVAGRTMVVHLSGSERAACGIITPTGAQLIKMGEPMDTIL